MGSVAASGPSEPREELSCVPGLTRPGVSLNVTNEGRASLAPPRSSLESVTVRGTHLGGRRLAATVEAVLGLPGLSRDELAQTLWTRIIAGRRRGRNQLAFVVRVAEGLQRRGLLGLPPERAPAGVGRRQSFRAVSPGRREDAGVQGAGAGCTAGAAGLGAAVSLAPESGMSPCHRSACREPGGGWTAWRSPTRASKRRRRRTMGGGACRGAA